MRVIAGTYRSRALIAPRGDATRPTSDRLRETLFNVLAPRMEGARFVDLFAGSGAVGIEAASRGAGHVFFAENAPRALAALRKNLSTLGILGATIDDRGVTALLRTLAERAQPVDIVFLDPPYEEAEAYVATLQRLSNEHEAILSAGAVVIAEHRRKTPPPETVGKLTRTRLLPQGDAALSFYRVVSE
jgi:16S rRNA (guanine(966)-N(2))-methyltransferase RsmD